MPSTLSSHSGRRPYPHEGEPLSEERQIKFQPSMMEELRLVSRETGLTVAEVVRRAVHEKLNPRPPEEEGAGYSSTGFLGRFLGNVPAGPWQEALEGAGNFTISRDVADELEAREGDIFLRAEGQSMDAAGIPDGAIVLVRPLPDGRFPRSGERVLVEIEDAEGKYWGTLKHWQNGPPIELRDGLGNKFEFPTEYRRIRPVAVARGIVAKVERGG